MAASKTALGRMTVYVPDPDLLTTRIVGRGFRQGCRHCDFVAYGKRVSDVRTALRAHRFERHP